MIWNISKDPNILDGTYEIRAKAKCKISDWVYSNVVTGVINRSAFVLQGKPHPTDNVLSLGEGISAAYNKNIDCERVNENYIHVWHQQNGQKVNLNLPVSCYNNQLFFEMDSATRADLNGEWVYVEIDSLYDQNGNNQAEQVQWNFKVSNSPVYWQPGTIELDLYSGTKSSATAMLKYERFSNVLPYELSVKNAAWLSITNPTGKIGLTGERMVFNLNTTGLALDTFSTEIAAYTPGFDTVFLPIQINVHHKPPRLVVSPADFESNVFVVADYKFKGGTASTDTMDILAAYIGAELRGVANLSEYGANHAAYIPVYGSANDNGKEINFRVWHNESGKWYNANPEQAVFYKSGIRLTGNFTNPRTLIIDPDVDLLREIPLKAGWNWFSLNLDTMTLNKALRSIQPSENDVIKTLNGSSEYTKFGNSGQWVSTTKLDTIVPESGYKLYLSKADTLYVHGAKAESVLQTFEEGWNLIGFPGQKAESFSIIFLAKRL